VGFGADTCPAALEAASQLGWAPAPPRVLSPRILPPCWGGLRRRHVSCGPGPYLPTGVGSGVTTCPTAPDPTSLLGWAPAPPRVLWPQTLLPCWGGLRCHHVSYGPEPCLPAGVGSGVTTCPASPDPARVGSGAAMCPHSLWIMGLKSKRNCGRPRCAFKARAFPRHTRAWIPKVQACPSAAVPAKGVYAYQVLQ
jgi:hypothetical protein